MPTTRPAPEWDWYDNTDLKLGEATSRPLFLRDEEYDEWQRELKEKERRRGPLGFALPKEEPTRVAGVRAGRNRRRPAHRKAAP